MADTYQRLHNFDCDICDKDELMWRFANQDKTEQAALDEIMDIL